MLSLKEFTELYKEIRNKEMKSEDVDLNHLEKLQGIMIDYLRMKIQEASMIFKKFDLQGILEFCKSSDFKTFENNERVFRKNDESKHYLFIIQGDVQIIEDEESKKILKTISSGTIVGHKIKTVFTKTGIAKNQTHLIAIEKTVFDNLIESINTRKEKEKFIFIKKYMPRIRLYSDDIIESLKPYFIKEDHFERSRIFLDNEFDEYVYLIAKGVIGCVKSINKIPNLKENLNLISEDYNNYTHVVMEKLSRGDIFGIYSALKHHKNNYTAEVLTPRATIYKIAKAHILLYFGGSSGTLPSSLRGLDTVQQNSLKDKLEFLGQNTHDNMEELKKFECKRQKEDLGSEPKVVVDESQINNYLKEAWKELENLDAKVANFKTNIMKGNTIKAEVPSNIISKLKEKEVELKDHSKIMGFGTNRVVGKQMNKTNLTSSQIKGMNMLKTLCDVKKQPIVSVTEDKKQEESEKKEERRSSRLKNMMAIDLMEESRTNKKETEETKQVSEELLPSEVTKNE